MPLTATSDESAYPPSVHVYCASSAACAGFSKDRHQRDTVTIDFAESTGGRRYDWSAKIQFQLTARDLAELCAYLFFPWDRYRWVHRTSGSDSKTLSVERQGNNVLLRMQIGRRLILTPVIPGDQYYFRNLLLSRLVANQPELPTDMHLRSLKALAHSLSNGG